MRSHKSFLSVARYGGLSVGGQLPILDVSPKDIQTVFRQLGQMLNISGVFIRLVSFFNHRREDSVCWVTLQWTPSLFLPQGHYSGLASREIGPFLRYMESEFNVKVSVDRRVDRPGKDDSRFFLFFRSLDNAIFKCVTQSSACQLNLRMDFKII